MRAVAIDPSKFGYLRAVEQQSAVIVMAKEGFPRIPCQYFRVKVIFDALNTSEAGMQKMLVNATMEQLKHRWTDLRKAGMILPDLSEHQIHIAATGSKLAPL